MQNSKDNSKHDLTLVPRKNSTSTKRLLPVETNKNFQTWKALVIFCRKAKLYYQESDAVMPNRVAIRKNSSWLKHLESNSQTILFSSCLLKEVRSQTKACQLCSCIHRNLKAEQDYLSLADVFSEKIDARCEFYQAERFICWEAMSELLKVVVFQMMMIRTV